MNQKTCPFIGLQDDPNTSLGFPSEGNYCHRAVPSAPVHPSHQYRYCLTPDHVTCPIYRRAGRHALPLSLAAPSFVTSRQRRILAMVAIPVVLMTILAIALVLDLYGFQFGGRNALIPQTGGQELGQAPGMLSFNLLEPGPTNTPFSPLTATPTSIPLIENCTLPEGWVPYVTNPTDSLFRLSVVYTISVEELQRANCMGDNTVILPGQVVYIPFVPDPTPDQQSEPIIRLVAPTNTSGPPVTPASINNTPVPNVVATQPVATNIPPTSTNPVPTATGVQGILPSPIPTQTSLPPTLAPTETSQPPTSVPPTVRPTAVPTIAPPPTVAPTDPPPPTVAPTAVPTDPPPPTVAPTDPPPPTAAPTDPPPPTAAPTDPPPLPTEEPQPTVAPSEPPPPPTEAPTDPPPPSQSPTFAPAPTDEPTVAPAPTDEPTIAPAPTDEPTVAPEPTEAPTDEPTVAPEPTEAPAPTEPPPTEPTPLAQP